MRDFRLTGADFLAVFFREEMQSDADGLTVFSWSSRMIFFCHQLTLSSK